MRESENHKLQTKTGKESISQSWPIVRSLLCNCFGRKDREENEKEDYVLMSQEMDIGQKKSKQKGAAKSVMQRKTTDVPDSSALVVVTRLQEISSTYVFWTRTA